MSTSSIGPCASASSTDTASRVSPGSGPVIIRSSPSSRFSSVDLPAFGRPTIARRSGPGGRGGSTTSSPSIGSGSGSSSSSPGTGSAAAAGSRSAISPIRSASPSPCSAETAIGLPSPRLYASIAAAAPALPSALFATSMTRRPWRRSQAAKCASAGVMPLRASMQNSTRSACATACSDEARMRPYRLSGAASSRPAVSISRTRRPRSIASASLASRVTPGVSATIARRPPASRLNSVDLPTLGRPAITTTGRSPNGVASRSGGADRLPRLTVHYP